MCLPVVYYSRPGAGVQVAIPRTWNDEAGDGAGGLKAGVDQAAWRPTWVGSGQGHGGG